MGKSKSSNKVLMTVIIILVVLLLSIIGFGVYYYMQSEASQKVLQEKQLQKQKLESLEQKDPQVVKEIGENELLNEVGPLYKLDPFTVNLLSHAEGERYLKVTIVLELSMKDLANELDAKKAIIRDDIIKILSNQYVEDITSDIAKEKVCQEIQAAINSQLVDGKIKNVYFSNFIIQ